jgi:hypothetical protein
MASTLRSHVPQGARSFVRRERDSARIAANYALTAEGRRTRRLLSECKDEFKGQRAVILGNGPSLKETNLDLLRNEHTFGLNRVYLAFRELGWATTFLVCINDLVIRQVADDLASAPARKFLRWGTRELFEPEPSTGFLQSRTQPSFMTDPRGGVWEGATVTFVALQLAYHMGFSTVILVGVDHHFTTEGKPHETVESKGSDLNHFRPDYFGAGFKWQLPDLDGSEQAYRLAKKAFEGDGRRILDATVGGRLQVFPKVELAKSLSESRESAGESSEL